MTIISYLQMISIILNQTIHEQTIKELRSEQRAAKEDAGKREDSDAAGVPKKAPRSKRAHNNDINVSYKIARKCERK